MSSGQPSAARSPGQRASAAAPLIVDGTSHGVLLVNATSAAKGRFGREQLDLLAELAAIAATWLEERAPRLQAEALLAAGAEVLARAMDMRDDYTGRHSAQVGALAGRVGERLGMTPAQLEVLECAARLHDVGKLAVPDSILQKPGPLERNEWAVMCRHPEWGAEMVARVPGLESISALVRYHHERWDGSGYPDALEGAAIPLASRVISVCDAFEAMVSERPYRPPLTTAEALEELATGAGTQFDPRVVAAAVGLVA